MNPELAHLVEQANAMTAAAGLALPTAPPHDERTDDWFAAVAETRRRWDSWLLAGAQAAPHPEIAIGEVRDISIPVDGAELDARVYTPEGDGPHPGIVFLHGGGFWMAGGEVAMRLGDIPARTFCSQLSAVVITVDYRLAPEFPYPTPVDDAHQATIWVAENAAELSIDPERVALLGISSGGALAAATARRCRDQGGPALCAQVLLVPVVDLSLAPESLSHPQLGDPLDADAVRAVRELYLGARVDPRDPDVSPGLDPQVAGMPSTFVVCAEHDVLCAQDEAYVKALQAAGVEAAGSTYPMTHSVALPDTVAAYMADIIAALGKAFRAAPQR